MKYIIDNEKNRWNESICSASNHERGIMKEITYRIYGLFFNLLKICPQRKKKVVLYMVHNSNFKDNLKCVYDEMKRRDPSYRFIIVSKKELFYSKSKNRFVRLLKTISGTMYFYIALNYHFATAEYILLNDNFLPLAYMKLKKNTKLIQLWHGVGAFKKFGLSTERDPVVRKLVSTGNKQVDYLFVSSANNISCYEEAMGVEKKHIFATGIPVTDFYFQKNLHKEARERVAHRYPGVKGKKTILYVPTFRKTMEENNEILKKFDSNQLSKELGEEYVILIRMHPQIQPQARDISKRCIDVTDYDDVKDLYILSDVLITDYSSVVVEYTLLNKPSIFFAYDLEQYDRGFYDSYEEMVPGPIVKNNQELLQAIRSSSEGINTEKRDKFLSRHYDYLDGQSTKRVVDRILY